MNDHAEREQTRLGMVLFAVLAVYLVVPNCAIASHRKIYYHAAYFDATALYYSPCRTGWWQSLRHGHVRPHWGTICH
jgi:hypothetical protein